MEEKLVLYSNGCPRCNILKKKLDQKNIHYVENDSIQDMVDIGIETVPVLRYKDTFLTFKEAIAWVNKQ